MRACVRACVCVCVGVHFFLGLKFPLQYLILILSKSVFNYIFVNGKRFVYSDENPFMNCLTIVFLSPGTLYLG